MTITNTSPLASAVNAVLEAGKKLKGAEARFTLSLRDAIGGDVAIAATIEDRIKVLALADWFHFTDTEKTAFWNGFCATHLQLDRAKVDKERMDAARSSFVKCLRPAIYLALKGLGDVAVNKDGAFTGVPMGEAINLLDDTGEYTKAAKAQIEREIENASIEGKTLDEAAAFERVKAKKVTTLGKAGVPTPTEAMKRWGEGAMALGYIPQRTKRAARTTSNADASADETFDAAIAAILVGLGNEEDGTAVDLRQPERLKALRNLHAALAAYIA